MKKIKNKPQRSFEIYLENCTQAEREKIQEFFSQFPMYCLLRNKERKMMQVDFENALLYYKEKEFPLEKALSLIALKNLGGFYARPPILWFSLDDAAKIYPVSMEHGTMSVFRLSVYFKKPVQPVLLQLALHFAIKRFPSFATTLKKGFFWHYLDTAKRRFSVEEEMNIPCQPLKVSQSGSQSFRVLYYDNRISIEFFHVLTDGVGGMAFLKVLLTEYLRLMGEEIIIDESVWNIADVPTAEEFENAFSKVRKTSKSSGFLNKPAVQLSGKMSDNKPCRLLHFKMSAERLKEIANGYGGTITSYMLGIMFLAAKGATDEVEGSLSFQVPVNMRKYYPSRTVRNFCMYCGIRLPLQEIRSLSEVIKNINEQMHAKASKSSMSEMLTATRKMVAGLTWIPLRIKQPIAKMIHGFLGDKIFTSTLSNLGVIRLPASVSKHIESMDFVLGTSVTNRASCSLVTVNDCVTFSISKMTADPYFEERIYDLLLADGVEVKVEGSEIYGR